MDALWAGGAGGQEHSAAFPALALTLTPHAPHPPPRCAVDDISLQTGLPAPSTLYSAAETLRAFDASLGEDGGDGALLLLPHACGVQLETLRLDNQRRRRAWGRAGGGGGDALPAARRLPSAASSRPRRLPPAPCRLPPHCLPCRGLRVATYWSPQPGMLLCMARLYDADGRLLEVSTSTAIRDAGDRDAAAP